VVRLHTVDMDRIKQAFLLCLISLFFFNVVSARGPFATEIITRTQQVTTAGTPTLLYATSTDPLFLDSVILDNYRGGDEGVKYHQLYCGLSQPIALTTTARFNDDRAYFQPTRVFDFPTPYRCTGAVYIIVQSSFSGGSGTSVSLVGYSMSDANFDTDGGGGGGGGSTDIDPLVMGFGALVFLFSLYLTATLFNPRKNI